jgi:hypothetical protein
VTPVSCTDTTQTPLRMTIKPLLTAAYVATITFVAGHDPVSLARDAVEMELRLLSHMPSAVRTRHVGVYQQSSPRVR